MLTATTEKPLVSNLDYLLPPNQSLPDRLNKKSGKQLILPVNFREQYHDIMIWEAVSTIFANSAYRIEDPNQFTGLHIHARGYNTNGGG